MSDSTANIIHLKVSSCNVSTDYENDKNVTVTGYLTVVFKLNYFISTKITHTAL